MNTRVNYASTGMDPDTATAFEDALQKARTSEIVLGHVIAGREVTEGELLSRANPAHPDEIVSRAHAADDATVTAAVNAAREAAGPR